MTMISCMAWRIGDILDIGRQLDWIEEHGFDAVSFHGSAGTPGKWQGIPLLELDDGRLEQLRRRLSVFWGVEVHAPFEYELRQPDEGTFEALVRVCRAAAAVGAGVVTVHSRQPGRQDGARGMWVDQIEALSAAVAGTGVRIGLEITGEFDVLEQADAPGCGITLDVGHMAQPGRDGRVPLRQYGTMGAVVGMLGGRLCHLHIHDYDGVHDHIEPGRGIIDFVALSSALRAAGYQGMLCLELNPDRVEPEGILQSAALLRRLMP